MRGTGRPRVPGKSLRKIPSGHGKPKSIAIWQEKRLKSVNARAGIVTVRDRPHHRGVKWGKLGRIMKIAVLSTAADYFLPLESKGWAVHSITRPPRDATLPDLPQDISIWIVDAPRFPEWETVIPRIAASNGRQTPQRILIRPRPHVDGRSPDLWTDLFDDFLYDPVDLEELTARLRTAAARMGRCANCNPACEPVVRFQRVFENACVGVVICDFAGHILECNQQFARMIGYQPDELCGISVAAITHPDDLPREVEVLQPVVDGRISRAVLEKRYLRKDGAVVWGRLYVSVGKMYGPGEGWGLALVEDITDAKAAEQAERESRERWQTLVENLPDRIAVIDSRFQLKYINRRIDPQALGRSILELIQLQDRDLSLAKLREAQEKNVTTSFEVRDLDDRVWYCRCVPLTAREGLPNDLVIIGTDLTERYRIEAELRQKEVCLRRLLDVGELDRRLIWDQLHNRLGQELTALSLALDKLSANPADRGLDPVAGTAARLAKHCLALCRNLADSLHSGTLERFGLVPALQELIHQRSSETGRTISLQAPTHEVAMLPHLATSLFRIAEQLLRTGFLAHQTAGIELALLCDEGRATLDLFVPGGAQPSEDEVACDPDLLLVRERALLLGGEFESRQDEDGLRWTCRIPLAGGVA